MIDFQIVLLVIGVIALSGIAALLANLLDKWGKALVSVGENEPAENIADAADESKITLDIPWQAPVLGTMAPGERYALMMQQTAPVRAVKANVDAEKHEGAATR